MKNFLIGCSLLVVLICTLAVIVRIKAQEWKSLPASGIAISYSPATDLEAIDVHELDKATNTIDIVTYALTDKAVANELLKKANAGVHIRIYRDLRQYAGETDRTPNQMSIFTGNKNVEVRIKHSSVLAHLKAYVIDYGLKDQELRDGSANWSEEGEKKQDNSLILTNDPVSIKNFEDNFVIIWDRKDNRVIQ